MIRVTPAPEPPVDFDKRVKNRRLDAIAELVGEKPTSRRGGRRLQKVADTRRETYPLTIPTPAGQEVLARYA